MSRPSVDDAAGEDAPAKVNLALHVLGRRADGYHTLESLIVFPPVGDRLAAAPAESRSLGVEGPFAGAVPSDADNLVLAAAERLAARCAVAPAGVRLTLTKRLPVAAGIGGGSADAAAALRLLDRRWALGLGEAALAEIGATLGADVPACVRSRPVLVRGIGERLDPAPALPAAGLLLANPRVPVSTPAVFATLARRENPPLPPMPAGWPDAAALAAWLGGCRNDLEEPALALAPEIGAVLARLAALPGALLTRLSGSGATAFALFASAEAAAAAGRRLAADRPGWWVEATRIDPA